MTILFTEEEKRYLQNENGGSYGLTYKEETPAEIAKSIHRKINAHKKWLKEANGNGLRTQSSKMHE